MVSIEKVVAYAIINQPSSLYNYFQQVKCSSKVENKYGNRKWINNWNIKFP